MDLLHQRCAGLDVHKKTVVASVRLAAENKLVTEVKTFATTTAGLLALSDWLSENGCTHAAMEATACTGSRSGMCCLTAISNSSWRMPRM
jgi:transposase